MSNKFDFVPESGEQPHVSPKCQIVISQLLTRINEQIEDAVKNALSADQKSQGYLSKKEAAEYLCIKPSTLSKWITESTSPKYSKLGSRVVFKREWLDDFIEKNSINP